MAATPEPGTTATPQPTPRPRLGARPFPASEEATLARLFARTAEIRGLPPLYEVEKLIISRSDAAEYLISAIEPEDEEEFALKQEVYSLLGLIPEDADLLALQISLLRMLVLGFYDPAEDALFLVEDIGINSTLGQSTIVHEMVHALQDQHYDINATYESLERAWDASAAYTHLIEGDARKHEAEFVGAQAPATCSATIPSARLPNIPAVIQRALESPYTNGLCFVRTVAARLPNGVDSLFENLPSTMEQVLHPNKYLEGENAVLVELRPLGEVLGGGWREVATNTFGEFLWWNYLLLGLSDTRTVLDAGAGWGGDRWRLYRDANGDRLIHMEVVWDSFADAEQFWRAFVTSLNNRGGTPRLDQNARSVAWQHQGKHLRAAITGDWVTLVVSDRADAADAAAGALLR